MQSALIARLLARPTSVRALLAASPGSEDCQHYTPRDYDVRRDAKGPRRPRGSRTLELHDAFTRDYTRTRPRRARVNGLAQLLRRDEHQLRQMAKSVGRAGGYGSMGGNTHVHIYQKGFPEDTPRQAERHLYCKTVSIELLCRAQT